ncbi:hypothetical protein NOV72_05250 [Caballeronia novacaledonica]|uniref:Uncharacterized protein n=1 Tax=Caballeronia novacaledonica TaxID=1544861 RepID=A0A2U3ID53_9BURK|nr:hypothetical protein [Caballeronia novacaledonica]SPB18051.1 hypothetical protein NOV72_05250 [Caballeronia novacaledonica]
MTSRFSDTREFVRGVATRPDLVCLISKVKDLVRQEIAHSSGICVEQGAWTGMMNVAWDSTAIAFAHQPFRKVVIVGQDGDVATYAAGQKGVEKIDPDPVTIRNACTIDGYVYACGMKRQVYERSGENQWRDLSAPLASSGETAGFESIQGYSREEIYAAGWSGEIWEFDGARWFDRAQLTNLILTCICCAPNGEVFVGGQEGTLIRGRHDVWTLMNWEDGFGADIWDVHWFGDCLYVATYSNLYTLDGTSLIPVDFGPVGQLSCFNLTSAGGTLWSIGHNDVASFDGTTWRRYD